MKLFSEQGPVAKGLFSTGPYVVPLYVAVGDTPIVFDAGMAMFAEGYAAAIAELLGDRVSEARNFLTHVHWDHCGAAWYLRKCFTGLQTGCDPRGTGFLSNERFSLQMRRLNAFAPEEMQCRPFTPEIILREGTSYRVSNALTVEVLETPGHTRESVSFYLPEIGALITGEALGFPAPDGTVTTAFLADYDAYYRSLQKLQRLHPKVICMGHVYVYTDDDAAGYIEHALRQTDQFRMRLEELLIREQGDREAVFRHVKAIDYDAFVDMKQLEIPYRLNLRAQIATIAARMARADRSGREGPLRQRSATSA